MKKSIVLCADDYGQAPEISQGILSLVEMGRLSAVSCLVTSAYWQEHAKWLLPFQTRVAVGLHFNLTEGRSSLLSVMAKAMLRLFNSSQVAAELHKQLDTFEQAMGCLPRFIDGHQHVHQFPVVRDALVQVYEERLKTHHVLVRQTSQPVGLKDMFLTPKKWVVEQLGASAFKQLLDQRGIPYYASFSGMYAFSEAKNYPNLFPEFLAASKDGGVIMCHPGQKSNTVHDPIAAARYLEYQYFAGDAYPLACRIQDIELR